MALVESAAAGVLPAQPNGDSSLHQASERQRFGHAVIHQALARAHLRPLLQQLLHLGMDVKVRGISRELRGDFAEFFGGKAGVHFIFRLVAAALVVIPVAGQTRAAAASFECF